MANENASFNLDALLDGTLDDLADMPEFKPFPVGAHHILGTIVDKATNKKDWVGGHPAFELKMKIVETLEMANPEEPPAKAGDETNVLYMMDNDMGQGAFKKLLQAVSAKFGAQSPRALIEQVKNLDMNVITKQRANKDKTQMYTDIVEVMVI